MNSYAIEFSGLIEYDTLKTGITFPVTLEHNSLTIDVEVKLDTGSSHCIFSREYGEELGFEIERGSLGRFGTAVGPFLAYGHEIIISVLDIRTVATVYFAKEASFTRNVLGRQGWLDRVRLGLIDYEGKLLLSAYGE